VNEKFIEMRKPKLKMVPEKILPGSWKRFDGAGHFLSESPYHMWRITVQHTKKIAWYLSWLIKKQGISTSMQSRLDILYFQR
jgi:hypothetical protein